MRNRAILIAALVLSACSSNGVAPPTAAVPQLRLQLAAQSKIQHVIIVVQENRSFNNLFMGYPHATTAKYGYDTHGNKITLQPVGLEATWDINHRSANFFAACDGTGSIPGTNCKMDGFDNETWTCSPSGYPKCPNANPPYSYVPRSETKPYFSMASQYVLADRMYASNFDSSSFISHQYIVSAQAESAVDYPAGSWGCPGGSHDKISIVGPDRQIPYGSEVVCWDPTTLGDELDNAGISWAYYATGYKGDPGLWSAYQAIKHIYYGKDWNKDVITPPSQFLTDVGNGNLRTVSWVTPTWADSDHSGVGSKTGPSWVASVVNAVGESKYWNSSAIFIFWDDYGGWFDSQPPAYVDYDGLGFRLPLLVISPYAKKGHVSHVHYEHGSILRFVEDTFGLGRLSNSDARAASPARDCFNFKQPPRTFVPIKAPFGADYFKREPLDNRIPDSE
jgi:phospholipase C